MTGFPWWLIDTTIYIVALIALMWGGNVACRFLLKCSGVAVPTSNVSSVSTVVQTTLPTNPSLSAAAHTSPPSSVAAPISTIQPSTPEPAGAGRMIGSLERFIILIGLAAGSWEIIAAVIALKTVGRFKELDERLQAEYFLIGSLASIVWAAVVSLALMQFDKALGFNILHLLREAKST